MFEKKRSATILSFPHKRANTEKGPFFENGIQMYSAAAEVFFKSSVCRGVQHMSLEEGEE